MSYQTKITYVIDRGGFAHVEGKRIGSTKQKTQALTPFIFRTEEEREGLLVSNHGKVLTT